MVVLFCFIKDNITIIISKIYISKIYNKKNILYKNNFIFFINRIKLILNYLILLNKVIKVSMTYYRIKNKKLINK